MGENGKGTGNSNNETDLKELILILWERKTIIISSIIIFSILSGLISMFVMEQVYDTKLNIIVSIPDIYETRYGQYTLPIASNEEYINLITSNDVLINTIRDLEYDSNEISLDVLKRRIAIKENKSEDINNFEVTVSAESPEEALKLAETLYKNYVNFVDVMIKERTINYFVNYFIVQTKSLKYALESTKDILEKNERLLSETRQSLNEAKGIIDVKGNVKGDFDYVIPIQNINPNYIRIENDIISNKQSIISIENSIMMNNKYIEELNAEKRMVDKYYQTGRIEKLDVSVIGIVETSVYLPSPPVAPTRRTSPSYKMNISIGIVIGLFIGIIVVMAKHYLYNDIRNN